MRDFSVSVQGISVRIPPGSLENELTAKKIVKKKQYGGKNNGRFIEHTEEAPVYIRDYSMSRAVPAIRCGLGAILFLAKQNPFIDIEFLGFEPQRQPLENIIIPEGITDSPKWLVRGKERWYFHQALEACQRHYCGTVKLPVGSGKTVIALTLAYNLMNQLGGNK